MSNGNNSTLKESGSKLTEVRIPNGAVVRKVIMNGDNDTEIRGFQFFDRAGIKLLEAGD